MWSRLLLFRRTEIDQNVKSKLIMFIYCLKMYLNM